MSEKLILKKMSSISNRYDYKHLGAVTEFPYSYNLGKAIKSYVPLQSLKDIGTHYGMIPSEFAIVSVDTHDMQRESHSDVVTYKSSREYIQATAFMLAFPYGIPLVLSSFDFTHFNQGKIVHHTHIRCKRIEFFT